MKHWRIRFELQCRISILEDDIKYYGGYCPKFDSFMAGMMEAYKTCLGRLR